MTGNDSIISHTKKWITDVVIGCNFCPFAAKEVKRESILYEVLNVGDRKAVLEALSGLFFKMDAERSIETSLLILPAGFASFTAYLQLADLDAFLQTENYEGIYQLASFHPAYLFHGSDNNDPANYTNRSPYPMLHILREESVTKAVDNYPDISTVSQKNIAFAMAKGLASMQALRQDTMKL